MSSHGGCDHPATKTARAQCRRIRDAGNDHRDKALTARRRKSGGRTRAPGTSESDAKSRYVGSRTLTRDELSPGIWVRIAMPIKDSRTKQWRSGYLVSAMNDKIRVKLDGRDKLAVFAWGEREIREEVWVWED